jgi:hypothetical protein
LLRKELHESRQPDRCTLFRTVRMAALMLAAVLHVAAGTTTEWNGMQRSGIEWNGGEEEDAICTLPPGIRHKKHDKADLAEILISWRPTISIMYAFPLAQRQKSAC